MGASISEFDAAITHRKCRSQVQKWKVKILEALGENGQVIIDVIPELEHLIGKQPKVPELEGTAAKNRFNLLFQKFIRLFATKEHPLVIFLDDLQWADSASLKLMQLLMSETNTRYVLLMGAYRDNEVFPAHPMMLTLDEIRKDSGNSQPNYFSTPRQNFPESPDCRYSFLSARKGNSFDRTNFYQNQR